MKIGQWLADCFLGGLSTASRVSFDGDRSTDTRGASYTRGASCDSKGVTIQVTGPPGARGMQPPPPTTTTNDPAAASGDIPARSPGRGGYDRRVTTDGTGADSRLTPSPNGRIAGQIGWQNGASAARIRSFDEPFPCDAAS
jgi:hypothetical protein